MTRIHEVYLGDGLYSFHEPEREMVWLRAPRIPVDHAVGLEPPVVDRFLAYLCELGYSEALERALSEHRGGGR
jgi:hypothetical protein